MNVNVCFDDWLRVITVCPLSKKKLLNSNGVFKSECGFVFYYRNGVPDFRVNVEKNQSDWAKGQAEFENWLSRYLDKGEAEGGYYEREIKADSKVYECFDLGGRVLDVGGQLGQIRIYLDWSQEYCAVDPFVGVHKIAEGKNRFIEKYRLDRPLNFIGGFAEFLPFDSHSFDLVNMRSCIDHFFNPYLALFEAYRVLRPGGKLLIGIKLDPVSKVGRLKELCRPIAGIINKKYVDHHIWHPSYEGLLQLCSKTGFTIEKEVWQTEDIVYGLFKKRHPFDIAV